MLLKRFTQYTSKFGKLSSGHRTGKGQFSFQSQRRAMPKNVQITVQLHSFHMLARLWSNSLKLGFNSMWTKNFQMYNLGLEKAEEPEIKLPTCAGSQKKQKNSKKFYFYFIYYAIALDCVDNDKLRKILFFFQCKCFSSNCICTIHSAIETVCDKATRYGSISTLHKYRFHSGQ